MGLVMRVERLRVVRTGWRACVSGWVGKWMGGGGSSVVLRARSDGWVGVCAGFNRASVFDGIGSGRAGCAGP